MFKHILFPSDFSVPAKAAFKQVIELATLMHAKVTLMHAHDFLIPAMADAYAISYPALMGQLSQELEEGADKALAQIEQALKEAGLDVETEIRHGNPGQEIISVAQSKGCDMIIMGSRGLGAISSLLLGSTSSYVLLHSPCAVMILPHGGHQDSDDEGVSSI